MEKNEIIAVHEVRIEHNEQDIRRIWKELNAMKKWVIAGMATFIVQLLLMMLSGILALAKGWV